MFKLQKNTSIISKTTYVNSPRALESLDKTSNSIDGKLSPEKSEISLYTED